MILEALRSSSYCFWIVGPGKNTQKVYRESEISSMLNRFYRPLKLTGATDAIT